jgi:Ca-activated chloride channel homolog
MMSWAQWLQLEWTHPGWSLLALQPLLMSLLLTLRRRQILHYADVHLLPWVLINSAGIKQVSWRGVINLAAWVMLAAAAAGPRLPLQSDPTQQVKQGQQLDVMVVLDVSPSMYAQDISPQRLQRAKLELLDLLPDLQGERLGLIAFSGSAGMIMPLHSDYSVVPYYLQIAEPTLFEAQGTALASALELALRNMPVETSPRRAILLLTDAESNALSGPAGADVWEAADKLTQANVPLFILGVGTTEGAVITLPDGNTVVDAGVDVVSSLDQTGFAELAAKTNGKFVQVEDGHDDWDALYNNGLLTLAHGKHTPENVRAWQELYAAFLIPSILLFILNIFRISVGSLQRKVKLLLLVLAGTTGLSVHDVYADESHAYAAYRVQNHALAQTLYAGVQGHAGRMGEGAAAYRRKDYQYAIRQYSAALLEARDSRQREQALFNLGNSYFMAGGFRAAADAFLGVMNYAPNNQDARANLALTAGKLAALSKAAKKSGGIEGRRGREVGGAMGEDASDKSLAFDDDNKKKKQMLADGQVLLDVDKAQLRDGKKIAGEGVISSEIDTDIAYRVALKKLELAADHPAALHKSLIKIEAAREYVPLPEMMPW